MSAAQAAMQQPTASFGPAAAQAEATAADVLMALSGAGNAQQGFGNPQGTLQVCLLVMQLDSACEMLLKIT